MRLAGKSSAKFQRLEVQLVPGAPWGSACNTDNDGALARVACRQLGLKGGEEKPRDWDYVAPADGATEGPAAAPLVAELGCVGDEPSLAACTLGARGGTDSCYAGAAEIACDGD